MAAEIVNLRLARKRKARGARETQAAENRAVFGQTKAEKSASAAEKDLVERAHRAHRRQSEEIKR